MFQTRIEVFLNRLTIHKVIIKVRHSFVIGRIGGAIAAFLNCTVQRRF